VPGRRPSRIGERLEEASRRRRSERRLAELFARWAGRPPVFELLAWLREAIPGRLVFCGRLREDGALAGPLLADSGLRELVLPRPVWEPLWGGVAAGSGAIRNQPDGALPAGMDLARSLAVPLAADGRFAGILLVGNGPADYTSGDLELLNWTAGLAFAALAPAPVHGCGVMCLVLDHVADGIVACDAAGRLSIANQAARRLLWNGARPADVQAWRDAFRFLDPDTGAVVPFDALPLVRALRGDCVDDFPLQVVRGDGSTLIIACSARPFPYEACGEIRQGALAVFRDITAQRRTEADLRRLAGEAAAAAAAAQSAAEAKSRFLATMSHEIRTPIHGIIGLAGLLEDTGLTREQRDLISSVRGSAEALLAIVNDILDFSKAAAGRLQLASNSFDLEESLHSALEVLALRAEEKGLDLVLRLHPGLPQRVRGDAGRLRQILLNLLSNAVKFTSRGFVELEVCPLGSGGGEARLAFRVHDSGVGIPPGEIGRLFQAFTQLDQPRQTDRSAGTGLGLAITARLVELMQGTLHVSSQPGEGSVFAANLRLQLESAADGPAPASGPEVLVVSDRARTGSVLAEQLAQRGLPVALARSPEEARSLLRSGSFPVVLWDTRLAGAPAFLPAPVRLLALASPREYLDRDALRQRGFAGCVARPPRYRELVRVLAAAADPAAHSGSLAALARSIPAPRLAARILVAEDDPVNQKVAARMLERLGCPHDIAADGEQALQAAASGTYALILLDCQMPVLDGLETARRIRQRESAAGGRRVPILAVTAHAPEEVRHSCLEAGMDDVLAKPLHYPDLRAALERWLAPAAAHPAPELLSSG
jgi:signal transduction histidine kinase/CheY-like chemotaxis protein